MHVIRDLASGNEQSAGQDRWSAAAAAWSEDSRTVLASHRQRHRQRNHRLSDRMAARPTASITTATNVGHLATGAGGLLAMETDTSRQNLARAGATPTAQPDIIDPANGKTWSPTFAPDGTLAFLSNRSGTNADLAHEAGAAPSLLYDGGLAPLFRLEFSPDGTKLATAIAGETA